MEEHLSATPETPEKPLLPLKGPTWDAFKIPLIPAHNETAEVKESLLDSTENAKEELEIIDTSKTPNKKKSEKSNVPLPYQEPEWSGYPPANYNLEIIKNGTYLSTLPIKASLVVFGRLDVCDVMFEHPSVSRYHAVIQYCKGDEGHPTGFYLYDLGSTHGTFLNKEKIKAKIYYKLKVGYIIKFGGSSRLHIFQGPEEEEVVPAPEKEAASKKEPTVEVCDWGMGDEAVEEEEGDLAVNPYALSTQNEDLYLEDPKKTLRGWFEREGFELEYSVEEKGYRTFSCTVRLPVDTPTGEYLPVEASVSGKKKEAVIACALESCRTLDRLGLLRQSHQESRQRKRKKWEENDYYDSDEDTFYDRTGEIEKRREMRKRLAKKVEVDNFQTIEVKLKDLNTEMEEIKAKIAEADEKDSQGSSTNESDSLDMYMSKLSESGGSLSDKFERRKLKLKLIGLEKEKLRLEKLSDIARPARLPPIAKHPGIIGKKIKTKLKLTTEKVTEVAKPNEDDEEVEENDSDEDKVVEKEMEDFGETEQKYESGKYGLILKPEREDYASGNLPDHSESVQVQADLTDVVEEKHGDKAVAGSLALLENVSNSEPIVLSKEVVKTIKPLKQKDNIRKLKKVDVYKTDPEYITWTPPVNQSGDGRTHLNDKYGY